ncbi:MAG: NgoFVII family restriction endonuclease [Bacteroidales bacterium]|nr:NgoFVII family restriction endonuclease [Bacteroidales bacterium]
MPDITLLDANGNVHEIAGLNWGSNLQNHTTPIDAYIPIHIETIRRNPGLFDKKGPQQTIITLHWDDRTEMQVLFEGNGTDDYPKQISSHPYKNTMGAYLRQRIGVANNEIITMDHLNNYGRTTVTIQRIDATNYNIDFHV